ncbi:hypothetical protein Tco_0003526 [Tanacetum coccineum]
MNKPQPLGTVLFDTPPESDEDKGKLIDTLQGLMICHKKSSTKGIITSYVLRENNGAELCLHHRRLPTCLYILILSHGDFSGYLMMSQRHLRLHRSLQDKHPPSPDYVPDPKHPPSPDYVPKPEYLEYLVPSDNEVPIEDQPLPADASPTTLSPSYVADSNLEEDLEEDPEEDPIDYPADGGDDDNDDDDEGRPSRRTRMRRRSI